VPFFYYRFFFQLNLIKVAIVDQKIVIEDDDLLFGHIVSNDDAIMSTLKSSYNYINNWLCNQLKLKIV
jgi:hypothetical protein